MNSVIRNSIKHIYQNISKRCLIKRCLRQSQRSCVEKLHLNDNKIINNNTAKLASHDENIINNYNEVINNNDGNHNNENHNNDNNMFTGGQQSCNRTIIVGPSFCGKTHLLFNKLQLIRLDNPEQQIKIISRSPEQYREAAFRYNNLEIEEIEVEEDLEDRTIQDFQNCCVVFDDMLDSNQKLIDPFFTRGRHNDLDVYYLSQSYFNLTKRTIRNNSNIIILFQQTLKVVEHIYRDIAGFDIAYDEFKSL